MYTSATGDNQVTQSNGFSQDSELLGNLMCQLSAHTQQFINNTAMLNI